MFCLQCGTQNSPDSNFCKECGGRVNVQKAAASPKRAVERRLAPSIADDLKAVDPDNPQLQRLLEMAFWHNQTGNVPAAIMACEAALIIDPDSSSALSLLGCLYERQGDIDKAVYAFERVVEINPDSEADQDKLAALKRGEYLRPVLQPIKYRWLPPAVVTMMRRSPLVKVAIPVACAIVFFAVGLAILKPGQSSATVPSSSDAPLSNIVNHNAELEGPVDPSNPTRLASAQAPSSTAYAVIPATSSPIYTDPNSSAQQSAAPRDTQRADTSADLLPSDRRTADGRIPPLGVAADANPSVPYTNSIQPIEPTRQEMSRGVQITSNGANMPEHTVVVAGGGALGQDQVSDPGQAPDTPTGPPPPASHIMIRMHDDAADSESGAANADAQAASTGGERGVQLQQQALQLQQSGAYRAAAHIYNQAIAAYKLDIASGTSPNEALRGIAACQTGLQICQQSQ